MLKLKKGIEAVNNDKFTMMMYHAQKITLEQAVKAVSKNNEIECTEEEFLDLYRKCGWGND